MRVQFEGGRGVGVGLVLHITLGDEDIYSSQMFLIRLMLPK